jgi:signal transduction histidine kinase
MIEILLLFNLVILFFIILRVSLVQSITRITCYSFLLYLLGCFLWGLGIFLLLNQNYTEIYFFGETPYRLMQLVYFGAALGISAPYLFFRSYNEKFIWKKLDFLALGSFLTFISLLLWPDSFFTRVEVIDGSYFEIERSWGVNFMTFYVFLFYFINIYTLWKKFKSEQNSIIRSQLKTIFLAHFLFVSAGIFTNWVLPAILNYPVLNTLGPTFYIFEALVLFYVITKYRFLNIKLTISQGAKFLFSLVVALAGILLLYFFLTYFWPNLALVYVNPLLFLFGIYAFKKTEDFLHSSLFHEFFWITDVELLAKLIQEMRDTRTRYSNLKALRDHLKFLFRDRYRVFSVELVVLGRRKQKKYEHLIDYFQRSPAILVRSEIPFLKQIKTDLERLFLEAEIGEKRALVIPLFQQEGRLIGMCFLGPKLFGDLYAQPEIELFSLLQDYLGLQLTNTLYQSELQKQVQQKTAQLKEKNIKLKKLDKAKDEFLSIASHELRTPMTIIKGYADFLLSGNYGSVNDQQKKTLKRIIQSTDDLLQLVNNILDLSQIEAGKIDFSPQRLPLKKSVDYILSLYQMPSQKRNIKYHYTFDPNLPKFFVFDPQKLRLILNNLIGNALKFNPEGASVWVEVRAINRKKIEFSVSDNGAGIPKKDRERIFNRFERVGKYTKKTVQGTGLGLNIVKQIVEYMGGDIRFEPGHPRGAIFIFSLVEPEKKMKLGD